MTPPPPPPPPSTLHHHVAAVLERFASATVDLSKIVPSNEARTSYQSMTANASPSRSRVTSRVESSLGSVEPVLSTSGRTNAGFDPAGSRGSQMFSGPPSAFDLNRDETTTMRKYHHKLINKFIFPAICFAPFPWNTAPVGKDNNALPIVEEKLAHDRAASSQMSFVPLQEFLTPRGLENEHESSSIPLLSKSLHTILSHSIHEHIISWIDLLDRVVSLTNKSDDNMHKRVLLALEEVQELIHVADNISAKFYIVGNSKGESSSEGDLSVEQELAQRAAEAIAQLRAPSSRSLITAPSKCMNHRPESVVVDACEPVDSQFRQLAFDLIMKVRATCLTQIGPDLDQEHTVAFSCGGVADCLFKIVDDGNSGDYDPTEGKHGLVLSGIELTLEVDDLFSNMEESARLVARSAAESILLDAAYEEQYEKEDGSQSPESITSEGEGSEPLRSHDDELMAFDGAECLRSSIISPVSLKKSAGALTLPPALHIVSPVGVMTNRKKVITTRNSSSAAPERPGRQSILPALVSPVDCSSRTLVKKRVQNRRNRPGLFPYSKKIKGEGPFLPELDDDNLQDVAGALTTLKHGG